jgi:hypothetical protein
MWDISPPSITLDLETPTPLIEINDIKQVRMLLNESRERIKELEEYIKLTEDLNMITPYITKYYNDIYRAVKRNFQQYNYDKMCSFPHNNWVELFSAASVESTNFDEFDIDTRPIHDQIVSIMHDMGELSSDDWDALQAVRKNRNNQGHPRLDDTKVIIAIEERWHEHHAYEALRKMMVYLKKQHSHARSKKNVLFDSKRRSNKVPQHYG